MIFKATKFKVCINKDGVWREFPVKKLAFTDAGASEVTFFDEGTPYTVPIDYVRVFLMEFTTKYDKLGCELYLGDIVKMEKDGFEVYWSIGLADGVQCLVCEQIEASVPLTENNVMKCEKVGNVYKNAELLQVAISPELLKKMEEAPASEETL